MQKPFLWIKKEMALVFDFSVNIQSIIIVLNLNNL
jgi:hypothetical protein